MSKIDFDFCASSFLALRHICETGINWKSGWEPIVIRSNRENSTSVFTAFQLDEILENSIRLSLSRHKVGIMLSGGMDSAILASYLPKGTKAYTLRSDVPGAENEVSAASKYAEINDLDLQIVSVSWEDYLGALPTLSRARRAPIHSIEPLILKTLKILKTDGLTAMICGENADCVFGGFDQLLTYNNDPIQFIERYQFLNPEAVLRRPVDVSFAFDRFIVNGVINTHSVMENLFADESLNSYINPCRCEGVDLIAPFSQLRMGNPLDINRVKNGDSKYLIRELYRIRYPGMEPPDKKPMPRAVGIWLLDWKGPKHSMFKEFDVNSFSSDQKWMLFALENFAHLIESA